MRLCVSKALTKIHPEKYSPGIIYDESVIDLTPLRYTSALHCLTSLVSDEGGSRILTRRGSGRNDNSPNKRRVGAKNRKFKSIKALYKGFSMQFWSLVGVCMLKGLGGLEIEED